MYSSSAQQDSYPLICIFPVDGLDVLHCFDWFVNDEIVRTKSVQNQLFSKKNYKSASLTALASCMSFMVPMHGHYLRGASAGALTLAVGRAPARISNRRRLLAGALTQRLQHVCIIFTVHMYR